jgi:hypothetical protein
MGPATIPLSALCEGLAIHPDTLRKWGNRGVIEMQRGQRAVERKFDDKFAFRLAAFNQMTTVGIPLPEAWEFTSELVKHLKELHVPEDQPVYLIYSRHDGYKPQPRVQVGVPNMLRIVEEAATKGWGRIVVVEIGRALRKVRQLLENYGQEAPDARERLSA